MKISELITILENAPDKDADVYVPHRAGSSTIIGTNFDDNNDLDIYITN